ncbi:MAG: valine--tRNA ligase [Pyrinomonadaceae bacterium]|nr:valine--tRNA ligase [Pyrinomonadaceae bacterium]
MEIAKAYNPKEAEATHYQTWEANGCFAPEINENPLAEKYSIVIPPPNVTGSLHIGHALQHTLMDVLTRRKRMQGFRTLWLPGTDHAGISVQRKVVEQLRRDENKLPQDIGREEFISRAWKWKEEFGSTITEQMRREGASVDWSRERFTMDESLSKAVRFVFVTLYNEGWIYRGKRIVNWCPKDKTVISDLEVKEETRKDGKLVYLRYPVKDSDKQITVATTRPETMLGDTAVAVNADDERYKNLIGKTIFLPLTNREIPIIADEYVDAAFGTGAVKITPAHDPNDYEVGVRHNLEQLVIMNDDATMNANAGTEFEGLDRFKAREKVIEKFAELGLLEKIEDYEISLPICERCKNIIEPLLSEQWFCRMDEMRDLALDLMKTEGAPHFYPNVPNEKVYTNWLENLKDWTISRQLWWGHQIPAWYDADGQTFVARSFEEASEKAGTTELTQDADVLDTWFSSALWAFSTFGWTGEGEEEKRRRGERKSDSQIGNEQLTKDEEQRTKNDLETFLPTDVLVTGRDIIFLWVSRMVMLTEKFTGEKPFADVVVTGTVLGKDGKPMSKSRGNGVDPLEMFDKFGVDATRVYLASIATGADIKWNDSQIETFRNFANKIWNATRFCLLNSDGAKVDLASLKLDENASIADRWIVSRLNKTALQVNKSLDRYFFHEAVRLLYQFFWNDFCDWYIELVKDEITGDSLSLAHSPSSENNDAENINEGQRTKDKGQIQARSRILTILEQALRMLHPFMPYLTEELWQKLPNVSSDLHHEAYRDAKQTIMLADFPLGDTDLIDERAESEMQTVIDLISKVRNIRAEMNIKPSDKPAIHVAANAETQKIFAANEAQILKLARAEKLVLAETLGVPKASAKAVISNAEIAVPLEGLIDFEKEIARLENQVNKLETERQRLNGQLSNANFIERAPPEKVDEIRERVAGIETQTKTLKQNLEALI